MIKKLKTDIPAGIVVFLVALPLCLGIALASGAPLLSGIISGIIGGLVIGFLSGSHTSVSGPAAGLAAVVLSSITKLGSFEVFLAAVLLAGSFQLAGGFFKAGFIANYIPSNVIKGLLAAIGIILILKQIPQALGNHSDVLGDFSFAQTDKEDTFSELLNTHNHLALGSFIISILSLLILIFYDKTPLKKIKFLPASLVVVVLGMLLNQFFLKFVPLLYNESVHLVKIPPVNSASSLITLPDFTALGNYQVWLTAVTIAIVASLETLLNLEAVDLIDPHKRQSPPNRELMAQGAGNMLAGLVGGIPITSVIVRSSVNIQSGAQSRLSAILHGVFLLLSILLLTSVLNLIPLASLAAILIFTGYKLAKISLFKEMYKKGWHQFIPFAATIVAIVFTDLLIGILIGLAISIFYLLQSNYKNPFSYQKEQLHIGEVIKLEFTNQVSFLNKASIKDTLWNAPESSKVLIDATYADFIDNDVLELINDFKTTVAPERNIQLNIIGLKEKYQLSDHIQFVNVLDKESQQRLTPQQILELLKAGNERFVLGKWNEKYFRHQIDATSHGQNPMAVIVSCIDSRTSPEIIFDAGIGDLVSIRIAGNIVSPEIIGSIELAVKEIGVKFIVVKGHSRCGAITAAVHQIKDADIATITSKIDKAILRSGISHNHINSSDEAMMKKITWLNTYNSIEEILTQSEYIKKLVVENKIGIIGAYYETSSGRVHFDEDQFTENSNK